MTDQKVFTATEARQQFFEILRLAKKGEKPLILTKDRNVMFTVTILPESKKLNKKTILQRMSRINLKSQSPQKIKEILNTKYDI